MVEDVQAARAYLSKTKSKNGLNLYDHLTSVLRRILDERPDEVVDIFEDMSLAAKRERFQPKGHPLQTHQATTRAMVAAEREETLVKVVKAISAEPADGEEEEMEDAVPNIMELAHYFEEGGIGLGKEETFRIFLALRHLAKDKPVQSVRFWGKVFGTENDYIVAEAEPRDTDEEQEEEKPEGDAAAATAAAAEPQASPTDEDEENGEVAPKPFKPPPVIPREELGEGSNKKIYFVCKEPGEEWVRLPLVTPAQIVTAQQIKKFFTGNLDAKIVSYPPFPGTEKNYLRAQIARISASTQISPAGFYQFPETEDEGEEEEVHDTVEVNPEFEGLTTAELTESLGNWVHHTRYLLPQGRCEWFNIMPETENDFEDEEDDDASRTSEQPPDEPEPEVGPPLLTPLSEDTKIGGLSAWTIQLSSSLLQRYGVAIVHSNLWPGAHSFGVGRKFENIYIGYGQKYEIETFNPAVPPPAQDEFQCGPGTAEVADPTPEEEEKARAAKEDAGSGEDDEGDDDQDDEDD